MVATGTLNQIFLGTLDLMLYSATDKKLITNSTSLSQGDESIGNWRRGIKMKSEYIVDTEQLWHKLAKKIENSNL